MNAAFSLSHYERYQFHPDPNRLLSFISQSTDIPEETLSLHNVDLATVQNFINSCIATNYFCYLNDEKVCKPIKLKSDFHTRSVKEIKDLMCDEEKRHPGFFFLRLSYFTNSDLLKSYINVECDITPDEFDNLDSFDSSPNFHCCVVTTAPQGNGAFIKVPQGFMVDNISEFLVGDRLHHEFTLTYYSDQRPELNLKDKMLYINYPILFNSI
jgi:hypothetical protein